MAYTMPVNGYPVPVSCKWFGLGVFGLLKSLYLQSASQQRALYEAPSKEPLQNGVLLV